MASCRGRVEECRLRGKDEVRESVSHLGLALALALASPNARGRTTRTHAWRRQSTNRPTRTIRQTSSVVSEILIPFRVWGLLRGMRLLTGRGDMEWNCSHLQRMLYSPHTAPVQAAYQQSFQGKTVAQQALSMPRPVFQTPCADGLAARWQRFSINHVSLLIIHSITQVFNLPGALACGSQVYPD